MLKHLKTGLSKPYLPNSKRGGDLQLRKALESVNKTEGSRPILRRNYFVIARFHGRLTANQIEAARKVLRRLSNRKRDKIVVRAKSIFPLTKKPTQARMGRGKGARSGVFVCFVKPGKILFEIETSSRVSKSFIKALYLGVQAKLSILVAIRSLKELYFL